MEKFCKLAFIWFFSNSSPPSYRFISSTCISKIITISKYYLESKNIFWLYITCKVLINCRKLISQSKKNKPLFLGNHFFFKIICLNTKGMEAKFGHLCEHHWLTNSHVILKIKQMNWSQLLAIKISEFSPLTEVYTLHLKIVC